MIQIERVIEYKEKDKDWSKGKTLKNEAIVRILEDKSTGSKDSLEGSIITVACMQQWKSMAPVASDHSQREKRTSGRNCRFSKKRADWQFPLQLLLPLTDRILILFFALYWPVINGRATQGAETKSKETNTHRILFY